MFLLFKELSPLFFISIFGVDERMPTSNLAKVPELPKLIIVFFLANKEPKPFPNILYDFGLVLTILIPSFRHAEMALFTSSDSKIFFAFEMFCEIEPIKTSN